MSTSTRGAVASGPNADSRSAPVVLGTGSAVRVDTATYARTWLAYISYVSGEIFGLRGAPDADNVFAPRDLVTLHIGRNDLTLQSQGRVLAVGPRTLRVLAMRGVGALDRRGAVRIQADESLWLTPLDGDRPGSADASTPIAAQLLDLSMSGCAVRSDRPLKVGLRVAITTIDGRAPLLLEGEIVRAWTNEGASSYHAGVQFDPMPPRTRETIARYFVEHIRTRERAITEDNRSAGMRSAHLMRAQPAEEPLRKPPTTGRLSRPSMPASPGDPRVRRVRTKDQLDGCDGKSSTLDHEDEQLDR